MATELNFQKTQFVLQPRALPSTAVRRDRNPNCHTGVSPLNRGASDRLSSRTLIEKVKCRDFRFVNARQHLISVDSVETALFVVLSDFRKRSDPALDQSDFARRGKGGEKKSRSARVKKSLIWSAMISERYGDV